MTEVAQVARTAAPAADRLAILRRNGVWLVAMLLFAALPLVVRSGSALTMLIAVVAIEIGPPRSIPVTRLKPDPKLLAKEPI